MCLGYYSGSPARVHHCTGGPLGLQWGVNSSNQWPAKACRGGIHHHAWCPAGTPRGGGVPMARQGPAGACKGESTVVTGGPLGLARVVQHSYQGHARARGQGGTAQLPGACRASKGGVQSHAGGPADACKGGVHCCIGGPLGLQWGSTVATGGLPGLVGAVHCHAQCPGGTHRGGSLVCMGARQDLNGRVLCHVREPARVRSRESTAASGVLWWLAAGGKLPCPGALGGCWRGCADVLPCLGTSQQLPVDVC